MKPSLPEIEQTIAAAVAEAIRDWGVDVELEPSTRLIADVGFTSMDTIDLFARLDVLFQRKFPYEPFITAEGGGYRSEITIGELAAFIDQSFDTPRAESPAL